MKVKRKGGMGGECVTEAELALPCDALGVFCAILIVFSNPLSGSDAAIAITVYPMKVLGVQSI